jgi:hypothetical protein
LAFERTLIQIRERTFLDVLDLALVVVRDRPLTLGLAALAGIAPFALFDALVSLAPEFPPFLLLGLVYLQAPWATAPLTIVLGDLMFGRKPAFGRGIMTLLRASPSLFLHQFVLRLLVILVPFVIPLIPAFFLFLNEVILLERDRWWRAPGRSARLSARRGSDLFGQWWAQLSFGAVFVACFWYGTGKVVQAMTSSELTWDVPEWSDLNSIRLQVGLWLAVAFFAVARFLTYIDHRIRKEGWGVELRLRDVGRALEEAETW